MVRHKSLLCKNFFRWVIGRYTENLIAVKVNNLYFPCSRHLELWISNAHRVGWLIFRTYRKVLTNRRTYANIFSDISCSRQTCSFSYIKLELNLKLSKIKKFYKKYFKKIKMKLAIWFLAVASSHAEGQLFYKTRELNPFWWHILVT